MSVYTACGMLPSLSQATKEPPLVPDVLGLRGKEHPLSTTITETVSSSQCSCGGYEKTKNSPFYPLLISVHLSLIVLFK